MKNARRSPRVPGGLNSVSAAVGAAAVRTAMVFPGVVVMAMEVRADLKRAVEEFPYDVADFA